MDPEGAFAQSILAGLTAGSITAGLSLVTELAKGASFKDAAETAIISDVTGAVSVGLAASGIGALYAGTASVGVNALMQKMLKPCEFSIKGSLYSALPPSFGGLMLGKAGLSGIQLGAVTGIISGPTTVAGNTIFK